MLELNKEYTYKEICEELGWKETGGNEKKKQIKAIEESYKFYHPENKKTHKPKKSYIFTEQIKKPELIDNRKDNGGARDNAGRKEKDRTEFNYLLNCLIETGIYRNAYYDRYCGYNNTEVAQDIYVSSSLIYKEFGFNLYEVFGEIEWDKKDKEVKAMFKSICLDAVKANTVTQICKKFGYKKNSLPKGILRQEGSRGKAAKRLIPDNDLLSAYNEYEQEAVEGFGYKDAREAYENGLYFDVKQKIDEKFKADKKYGVNRYNIISIEADYMQKTDFIYDVKKKNEYQTFMYNTIIASIEKSVNNRITDAKDYKRKLNKEEKRIMESYLNQLLRKNNIPIKEVENPEIKKEEHINNDGWIEPETINSDDFWEELFTA